MKTKIILILFSILFCSSVFSQNKIKVMSYNLLRFGVYGSGTGCDTINNKWENKVVYLRTIVSNQQPDILAVCELSNAYNNGIINGSYATIILNQVLNYQGVKRWAKTEITNVSNANDGLANCLFYDKNKVDLIEQLPSIQTSVRDINLYKLKYKATNTIFHIAIAHLKASNTVTDQAKRAEMTAAFMEWLDTYQGEGKENFMIMGDFNVYTSSEEAFQNLINPEPAKTQSTFWDPIDKLGNWNKNSAFAKYFTQSTVTTSDDCKSNGGMDDRFDFILVSTSILNGTKGFRYVSDSYCALGQDGNRFDQSLIVPTNYSLPNDVINALAAMSDHLPIVADFDVTITGIEQYNINANFVVNINNDEQNINYQIKTNVPRQIKMNIYSVDGKLVYENNILAENNNIYSENINALKSGLYLVVFKGEDVLQSYKIVK